MYRISISIRGTKQAEHISRVFSELTCTLTTPAFLQRKQDSARWRYSISGAITADTLIVLTPHLVMLGVALEDFRMEAVS